jgi:lysozyme
MRSRRGRAAVASSVVILVALAGLAVLVFEGVIWPGRLLAAPYEVRGVDVSSYQGEIDWPVLADEDIEFAYIKATEGSSSVDERFDRNWRAASETSLLVGAYHFLSFESSGAAQAAHVIEMVPDEGTLPIAVDVEYYGRFFDDPPTPQEVDAILAPLLAALEAHYGVPPVLYATPAAYERYIAGSYERNPIWIRSVVTPPRLEGDRAWTIWQYSHRDRLRGYDGEERFIDMNAFPGTRDELAELARPSSRASEAPTSLEK